MKFTRGCVTYVSANSAPPSFRIRDIYDNTDICDITDITYQMTTKNHKQTKTKPSGLDAFNINSFVQVHYFEALRWFF